MRQRIPLSIEVQRVLKMLMTTLLFMLVAVSGYFFIKTSAGAERGYLLKENQLLQNKLELENRLLKQQVLEVQSIQEVEKSEVVKNMAPQENPLYVKAKAPLTKRR